MEQNADDIAQADNTSTNVSEEDFSIAEILAENAALRAKLAFHGIPFEVGSKDITDSLQEILTAEEEPEEEIPAGLFGIKNSSRDHSVPESWGKNQFNNSFPVGLISYMASKEIKPVYLKVDKDFNMQHDYIDFKTLMKCAFEPDKIHYAFESPFLPFKGISSSSSMPGNDVVVNKINEAGEYEAVSSHEIKLTTLPDSTTAHLDEDKYGSELVVRPDTIVYQALSICNSLSANRKDMTDILNPVHAKITDWFDVADVATNFGAVVSAVSSLVLKFSDKQQPLLIQPVWKTEGKAAIMADQCLDAFVWSDFSLMKLFIKSAGTPRTEVGRNDRTVVWLFLMLHEFANTGQVDHRAIIDRYTYGTKNDKAFAASGKITNAIMSCKELTTPRIAKTEIRNIILGDGQKYLSPERRFDAVIQSDVSIFQSPVEKVAEAVSEAAEQD